MNLEKEVFTTFEASKLCNANITSIKNWIDKGELSAFRTPGGHYRIERDSLKAFLSRHDMPNPLAEAESRTVLLIHSDANLVQKMVDRLGEDMTIEVAEDPLDGLIKLGNLRPRALLVDASMDGLDALAICERVARSNDLNHVRVVVCGLEDESAAAMTRDSGAHHVVEAADGEFGVFNAILTAVAP